MTRTITRPSIHRQERVVIGQKPVQTPALDLLPALENKPVLDGSTAFIATADLHLRDDTPICRTDDYQEAQMGKLRMMCNYAREYDIPILIAGDVFDTWRPSHRLVAQVIDLTRGLMIIACPGQHDLYLRNRKLINKTGLGVLQASGWKILQEGQIFILPTSGIKIVGYSFGEDPPKELSTDVLLIHKMTWMNIVPYPECKEPSAIQLARKYKNIKIIITGDNHQRFVYQHPGGPSIINPGSMMRATADQINHRPCFYAVSFD